VVFSGAQIGPPPNLEDDPDPDPWVWYIIFAYTFGIKINQMYMGVSLNDGTHQNTLKSSFLVGKPHGCWGNPPL